MKGCFIINPKSGPSITRDTVYTIIKKIVSTGAATDIRLIYTEYKGHATDIAKSLDPKECDFVFAVGGDGTASEVLNGLVKSGSKIPFGILPFGTTNDFAVSVGLPKGPQAVANMIKDFTTVPIDIGMFYQNGHKENAKCFINVAAGGLLSAVAHSVPSDKKNIFGRFAYLMEGAKNLSEFSLKTTPLVIDCDGTVYHENAFLFEISNSKSTGGFSKIAPSAYINDGKFNLFLIRDISAMDVVPLFTKIMSGTHVTDPRVLCITASKMTVSYDFEKKQNINPFEFPMDCDGESADDMPVTIENVHNAVNLIVPKTKKVGKIIQGFLQE